MAHIFQTYTEREGYKITGASLPFEIHNYLTLYSLVRGTTRTKILKNLLEDWIKQQPSEEDLLMEIVKLAKEQWKIQSDNVTKEQFKKELIEELQSKKVQNFQIDLILKAL